MTFRLKDAGNTGRLRPVVAVLASVLAVSVAALAAQPPSPDPAQSREVTLRLFVVESEMDARRIVERIAAGESPVVLARTMSQDPSAASGGLVGPVAVSGLRPELREALHGVGPGQLTPIVRIPTGFAILEVLPDHATDAGTPSAVGRSMAAAGSVKYVTDVSGFNEATVLLRDMRKPADWNLEPRRVCDLRTQSLAEGPPLIERRLAEAATSAAVEPFDLIQGHLMLAQLHAYRGLMQGAIEQLEKAYQIAVAREPEAVLPLVERLGIAHLHKAEMDNGLYHAPGDRCLLSIDQPRVFAKTADVERAIAHFSRYLDARPDDLDVRWLLNLASMASGAYPDRVPGGHAIPRSVFASAEEAGRFVDVAPKSGLSVTAAAGGVIVDAFDSDGLFDVVTSSMDVCAPLRLFRRTTDGRFVEQTATAGLDDQLGGLNIMQTDYDNDGCLDVFVLRGGWEFPQRNSLLRGDCQGAFTDVTAASGLAVPVTSTQAAVWTDINQDGLLDLFIGNENSPAQLFVNKGDGSFQDVAAAAGVDRTAFSKGVAAGDYDNDGWPDLYVSTMGGTNTLYRNNRDGTFSDLTASAGVPGPSKGFATWFFDYDNDGWQDLFATTYVTSLDETVRTYLGRPNNADTLKLYRNLGDGTFQDVTRQVGLDKVFMPMGANFGDIDNDGFLDIYLGTGNPSYASLVPSVLLRNRGGTSFVDVTGSSGTGELHKGHGVAFADIDADGDQEILFQVGGATPGDVHALRLFENPGHGGDWLALKLVGVRTNRAAIGARIAVTVQRDGGDTRTIERTVGSGGSFGASPLSQHIGLGQGARIVSVQIWWPTSNTRQRFSGIEKNSVISITEFASDYVKVARPRLPLGGATHGDMPRR